MPHKPSRGPNLHENLNILKAMHPLFSLASLSSDVKAAVPQAPDVERRFRDSSRLDSRPGESKDQNHNT